jgi:hypothetical protein
MRRRATIHRKHHKRAIRRARKIFYEANSGPVIRRAVDFTVDAALFDAVEDAFHHTPAHVHSPQTPGWKWGYAPVLLFQKTSEHRDHLVFKGVCMFRGE